MKSILLLALSAIILSQSYGFVYADHEGNSHANFQVASEASEVPIITIETDSSSYVDRRSDNVSGSVSDFRESDPYTNFDVTIRLIAPNNNIVSISQVSLDDGFYSTSILAQGPLWKLMVITPYLRVKVQTEVHLQLLLLFIQNLKKSQTEVEAEAAEESRSSRSRRSS